MRAGRAAATTFWEERLLDVAKGGSGNAQAIQWALRNRSKAASGWHNDAQRLEHSGPEGAPVQVETQRLDPRKMTREQRRVLREILLATKTQSV